jgi:hypothetical protein
LATRELLSPAQRLQFTEIPDSITTRDIARYYTFSNDELKIIKERRRPHNRLGFAVQLCYLRFPGRVWNLGEIVPESVLLSRLDELRRYAILVAFLIEWSASLVDYAIGMHDKMMSKLFNKSEHQHGDKFQRDGKAINEKVRLYAQVGKALIAARDESNDAYQAIESVLDWEKFISTVAEAEKLARPADFDYLELLDNRYSQ